MAWVRSWHCFQTVAVFTACGAHAVAACVDDVLHIVQQGLGKDLPVTSRGLTTKLGPDKAIPKHVPTVHSMCL